MEIYVVWLVIIFFVGFGVGHSMAPKPNNNKTLLLKHFVGHGSGPQRLGDLLSSRYWNHFIKPDTLIEITEERF